ncbi:MAG: hypothetical protein AB1Z98_14860 [Nannocystaceae bacterium]
MPSATDVPRILLNAPLPELIQRLGLSVAQAQAALDENSIATAKAMSTTTADIDGTPRSLLELGFTPTFYAFTEATVEAKLAFTITESTELSVGAELNVGSSLTLFSASVNASYTRKYSFEAQGSSSIAARLVSLPPPEPLLELLNRLVVAPSA